MRKASNFFKLDGEFFTGKLNKNDPEVRRSIDEVRRLQNKIKGIPDPKNIGERNLHGEYCIVRIIKKNSAFKVGDEIVGKIIEPKVIGPIHSRYVILSNSSWYFIPDVFFRIIAVVKYKTNKK